MNTNTKAVHQHLLANNIKCNVKYIAKGSMKNTYRLWNRDRGWNVELANQLNSLGFRGFDHQSLHEFSSNGSQMCVFVCVNTNKKIPTEA